MTDLKSPAHPLDLLPAMLNLVLIQTGKLLRDPECRDPKAIGLAKSKVNEYVPAANGRFHDALDEVEIKILDAKAVMERDLSVIRKKRALREGVKIPSIASSPAEDVVGKERNPQEPENMQIDAGSDLPMLDVNAVTMELQDTANGDQPQALAQGFGDKAINTGQDMPQDASKSAGLAITLPVESKSDEKDASKTVSGTNHDAGANIDDIMASTNGLEQPAGTNGVDIDFESMFNDAEFGAADGTMNFDMDFPTTEPGANQGQDILADNAFENIAIPSTDLANVASTANEDITGLLDDVFNQGGDPADGSANPANMTVSEATKTTEAVSQAPFQPAAPEEEPSQFDDLFGTDTFDLGGNEEVLGDGNLADFDFDEEWLKM